jgi:hypothetical protein
MFYYDESGEMAWTDDPGHAQRHHVRTMLGARRYALAPEGIGRLHELLGPVPPDIGRVAALVRVQKVLQTMGLGDLPLDEVVQVLDVGWQSVIQVGGRA